VALTNRSILKCAFVASLLAVVTLGVAGCEQYQARRDGITMGLGNANRHNIAVQTVDPWPEYVADTRIAIDGERARIANERYRANKSIEPQGLTTQAISEESN
jgi:hypothetical protein